MDAKITTPSIDELLERAVRRATQGRESAARLLPAVQAVASKIALAAQTAGLRASIGIGDDLDGEAGDYPTAYYLTARDGAVVVERNNVSQRREIWRAIWVDEPASDWEGWSVAVRTISGHVVRCERCRADPRPGSCAHCETVPAVHSYRSVPRHILVIVARWLIGLARDLDRKADEIALQTEAAELDARDAAEKLGA
jgi:hypothetical protein